MKRGILSTTLRRTSGDLKKDLGQEKLAAIGAIAMAYNKVEDQIEGLFGIATKLDGQILLEVGTRIGIGEKVEIIKCAANLFGVDEEDKKCLSEALGKEVFIRLKGYRNAVIHARLINAPIGVGITFDRRAKINEVLLSEKALDALYHHLLALARELQCAASVLILAIEISTRAAGDPDRSAYEAAKPQNSSRFRRCCHKRKSLPRIPDFPSEAEFYEADVEWMQAWSLRRH
jgi:hypothetical protein